MSKFVLTAQLQLQAPNNVAQVVSQIQSQLNNVSVNVQVQGSAKANQQLQQITQSTQAATTAAGRMGNAFAVSIRRFAAFSIATRAVGLFTSTLADAVKTAIDFERELIKISQVTGRSVSSLRDLTDSVTNLSTGLGVTSKSLLEVTTVLTQAGLSSDDTKIALESLAKAALAPNFDSIQETAEGAIAILAQFKQGVGALEGQLSSIDAVAGAFAVEAGDLIDVIRRSGGVFKASGGSLNELLALFTSVRATTRESAESIGTGLRTIFTRIQRPETIEFLKQFGVELVDLNGKFVGPYEAIRKLSEALSGLGEGDLTFISIAEELGGFRQIGKVLPLLQQFSTAQAALNVAQNAGNGLTKNAVTAQASLAIRIIKVKEEFLALVRSMTETTTFQVMANTALALASALIKIADSIKPLIPLLAAVAAFKAVKGIGGFLGGIGAGLTSGRTFHSGGKVHAFAKGGLVPGSGSGTADDIPAMLSSGEFVMKQSAVKRIGANTLAQMNNGGEIQQFVTGGRAIVGATPKLKSTQKRDTKYSKPKDIAGSGNIQFDVNPGEIGAFVLTPPKGSEGGYSASQPYKFTLPATNKYSQVAASQAGLSQDDIKGGVNAVINPTTYPVFFPGLTEGRANLANNAKYASAVHKGFLDGISTGVNSTIQSVTSQGLLDLPPAFNTNEQFLNSTISKIQSDNQVRSSIEGYLFEGMISAFTGASAAGGRANFDFPRSAISQNKDKLAALFGSAPQINKLVKAEAKRSYDEVGGNIQRKLANDIIAGYKGGVTLKTSLKKQPINKYFGGIIQKFAMGGRAKGIQDAPLVDDILQASGSILPRPSAAIQSLIKAGGGAVDVDRTLKRTVGDTAYAKAPTPGAKDASLNTYFRDEVKRLQDLKTAPVTQFGKELQAAIKSGQLDARKISIISKSKRVKGAAEYLSSQFGIPVQNMIFTQGASKQPAIDAIRNKGSRIDRIKRFLGGIIPQRFALGGMGKASRKVDYASGVGPSPFASQKSKKLGQEVYALQKSSGLSIPEFEEVKRTADTYGYNIAQFKAYLAKRVAEKKNKSQLKTDVPSLLNSLKDGSTPQAAPRQVAMAQQLSGPEAASQTKSLSPEAEKMRIALGGKPRAFASGGLVPGVGNSDTVPATLQEGDFVIRKSSVNKIGVENLASMSGYATGGNVNKSVPALLTPGEWVYSKEEAKSIGYGNLNRMNTVGKYANGGFVGIQKFATGTAGSGVKASGDIVGAEAFNLNPKIFAVLDKTVFSLADLFRGLGAETTKTLQAFTLIEQSVPSLVDSIRSNSIANNRTKTAQEKIAIKYAEMIVDLQNQGKSSSEIQAAMAQYVKALDNNTKATNASAPQAATATNTSTAAQANATQAGAAAASVSASSATTSAAASPSAKKPVAPGNAAASQAATTDSIIANLGKKDAAVVKQAFKDNATMFDKLTKELQDQLYVQQEIEAAYKALARSLNAGIKEEEALNQAKKAAEASLNKSSAGINKSPRQDLSPSASMPPNVVQRVKSQGISTVAQGLLEEKAKRGAVTNFDLGKGVAQGVDQAQLKAIAATNAQAVASQKAAQANLQEASASGKAASADMQESISTNGGTKDFGNFAMGLSLVSGTIQSLLPPLQENSSVFLQMAHSGLTLVTTLSGIAFSLSAFGINLNAGAIASAASAAASFLQGTAGTAAAAATTALATTAATSSVTLTGMSVTSGFATGSLLKLAAAALSASSQMLGGIVKFVKPLMNAAGPLLSFAAGGALAATGINLLVSEIYGVSGKLKESISKGNVDQAGKLAGQQYDVDSGNVTRMLAGVVTAIGVGLGTTLGATLGTFAGPIAGNIAGGIIGGLAGAAAATALINTFSGIAEKVNILFGGNTRDSTIALAQAQAQAVATQTALTASGENATKAMNDLQNGAISAAEAVGATRGGGDAVLKQNELNKKAVEENEKNKSGMFGGFARGALRVGTLGLAGYMGVESGAQRNARIDQENKDLTGQSKKSQETLIQQSTPAINALSGDIAAAGGTFQDVMDQIKTTNPGLYFALLSQGSGELSKAFDNIKKETERAQKAFNAMNLGMQNVQGAAAAAALGVNNYVAAQQAGNIGLEQSLAVLEASVTSAAQGISDVDFGKALSDASEVLYEFGANPEQVTKFQGNVRSVNEVQKNQSTIFASAKDQLAADIRKSNSADQRKKVFSDTIDQQLKAAGYDDATRQRFKDATGNMSDEQLKKIGEGDFTAFEESINELGKKTMEQVNGPLKAAIEIQKQLNELTKQRIEAERQLMSAQIEASNVRMEAMDIAAKYGGPKVTPEMRAQNVVQQANIQSRGINGVTDLKTGSAAELSARTQQLSRRQAEISGIRMRAANGDSAAQQQLQGESGTKLADEEKRISEAAKSQVQATRDLIKSKEEELKIIKEKNQLERNSIDSLVSGDIEKFFEQQAAVGAQAAVATGDQRLIGQFGMSALGGAAQETRRQQEAGVQELYGQKLSGPGGLTERAYGSAISAAGIQNPLAMAQVAAGSTGAEAAVESDIRDLAATMGPTADIQTQAAQDQLTAAQMQIDAARAKGEEAVAQMQARQMATGGIVYASRGIFVPRGTDTVPAMLTPGEFVVRREAVQRNNNLSILQAMNKGVSASAPAASSQSGDVAAMATGGIVKYRSGGSTGPESGGAGISAEALNAFAAALSQFNTELTKNIKTLSDTKFQITLSPTNINVNLTGTSFLANLTASIKQDLLKFLGQEISNYSVGNDGKLRKTGSTLGTVT